MIRAPHRHGRPDVAALIALALWGALLGALLLAGII